MWDIGYFFDGCSFEDGYSEKELYQDIAFLKSYNHEYENKVNRKRKPFETNGVERILTFDHAICNVVSTGYVTGTCNVPCCCPLPPSVALDAIEI